MLVALILLLVSSHYQHPMHPSKLDLCFFQQSLPIFLPYLEAEGEEIL